MSTISSVNPSVSNQQTPLLLPVPNSDPFFLLSSITPLHACGLSSLLYLHLWFFFPAAFAVPSITLGLRGGLGGLSVWWEAKPTDLTPPPPLPI